jgi:hypothetical protein
VISPVELLILAVPLAIVVGIAARSFRPIDDRAIGEWTRRYGLLDEPFQRPLVSGYLRRTRRWRAGGAVAGALGAVSVTALTDGSAALPDLAIVAGGYLLGAIVAEVLTARPGSETSVRGASLETRRVGDYLPSYALFSLALATLATLTLIPMAIWNERGVYTFVVEVPGPAALAVGLATCLPVSLVVSVTVRAMVRRPQPAVDPNLITVDDAIRSASIHATAAAGLAYVLLVLSWGMPALIRHVGPASLGHSLLTWAGSGFLVAAIASWTLIGNPRHWKVHHDAHLVG